MKKSKEFEDLKTAICQSKFQRWVSGRTWQDGVIAILLIWIWFNTRITINGEVIKQMDSWLPFAH